jgi:hypothetical protein
MPNVAVPALLAVTLLPSLAAAEGELGPMFGGGIVATHGSERDIAGLNAELVLWYGRIGVAAEGARQWNVDGVNAPAVASLGASLRLLAFRNVVPSLLDSREVVDLGIELQGIVERAWWDEAAPDRDPVSYGVGIAVRLRGANDDDRSNLLAESRVFVRVMRSRSSGMDVAARDTMPDAMTEGVGVMIGLGAAFGGGQSAYVEQLRRRNALDSEWLVR